MSDEQTSGGFDQAAEKVKSFPTTPGVYLMKDHAGRVIYVGKAKNLRSRAGSYFLKAAAEDQRTASWIGEIVDVDFVDCDSEVDALLMESRLIKDIQPKYNKEQKDDKTFPYLMITTREEFPRLKSPGNRNKPGSSCMVRLPVPGRCGARSGCCKRFFDFAPAPSTSVNRMNAGTGSSLPVGQHQPVHRTLQFPHQQGGLSPRYPSFADLP